MGFFLAEPPAVLKLQCLITEVEAKLLNVSGYLQVDGNHTLHEKAFFLSLSW